MLRVKILLLTLIRKYRMLLEKKKKELYIVITDISNPYNEIPRPNWIEYAMCVFLGGTIWREIL